MRVWKYTVPIQSDPLVFSMPLGAVPLAVQVQHGVPRMWVTVEPVPPFVERSFRWVGTGHDLADAAIVGYVGTVQCADGALVFHLFEVRGGTEEEG